MVEVESLLPGQRLRTTVGSVGFCGMTLITGSRRTLVDVGHVGRRTALLAALRERGLGVEDIDVLVLTHAHWDHAQNVDLFPHAPLLIHPLERRYAARPHVNDWATPPWTGAMLNSHPNLVDVDEGYEIEPGVTVLHTPGHSPGSISLAVETAEGCTVVAGDAIHFPGVALSRRNPLVFWNAEQADASIRRLIAAADVIYPGHDRPFRLVDEETFEYLMPLHVELWGHEAGTPGIHWNNVRREPWVMPGIADQEVADLLSD
jgi:N-acyl homoserine lactone hydrolase